MITTKELRQKYLEFFKSKEHKIIPSASLIPENDPTILFTTAGMHPLVPYLMGEAHPEGNKLVNVQKCIRTIDIDEVGDISHGTFFEMLGNWSLGDYFKKESIEMSWEFLTSKQWLGLDKEKLAITVFGGNVNAPKDEESVEIWKSVSELSDDRIAYLEDNWWGPAGITGPCGPDTEIFYWVGNGIPPINSNPKTDEDNWLEIWNNVFMQYNKTVENKYEPLEQKNVDTGMGLDRTVMVLNGYHDIFQIDTLWPIIQKLEEISGKEYIESTEVTKSMRIIVDHVRASVMIMGDRNGMTPSNVDQGYVVRKLIRRAIHQAHTIGVNENFTSTLAKVVIEIFEDIYPDVKQREDIILNEIAKEESKFRNTLEKGLIKLDELVKENPNNELTGVVVFHLYQSYGFPIELSFEVAKNKKYKLEKESNALSKELKILLDEHRKKSRQGAEKKFKGGLADEGEASKKYHTATHLLHIALRKVLGNHVEQKGSNITGERMRFDFSHGEKLTDEQKEEVEKIVNMAIESDYPISCEEMTVDEAKKQGAIGLFENKYGSKVKVYSIGDFSKEICGGPHVEHTGILGEFKIKKEKASSSGIRRIKAILQ